MVGRLGAVVAIALFALHGTALGASASIPVHVETHEMVEMTSNNGLALQQHNGMGEVDIIRCENDWEAIIDEDGYLHMHNVQIGPGGAIQPLCSVMNDCADIEWHGQIFEDEVTGDPKMNFTFCISPVGTVARDVVCDMGTTSMHCNEAALEGTGGAIELDGEVNFSEPVEIEDV